MLVALIPCFNEWKTIGEIVDRTKPFVDKIVVVDDGSTDKSGEIAKEHGAIVLVHKRNRGSGAARMTGIDFIRENFDAGVITLDADGQHFPEDIPRLLTGGTDIIIGTRIDITEGLTFYKKLLNSLASKIASFFARQEIRDSESGFRFYSSDVLKDLNISYFGYGGSVQSIIDLSKKGYSIGHVSVKTIWDIRKEDTHGLGYGVIVLLRLLRRLFRW